MKQQPKIIVPNNDKYTRHLKLTEKQEQELIAYNKAGAEYFKKAFQHRAKKTNHVGVSTEFGPYCTLRNYVEL